MNFDVIQEVDGGTPGERHPEYWLSYPLPLYQDHALRIYIMRPMSVYVRPMSVYVGFAMMHVISFAVPERALLHRVQMGGVHTCAHIYHCSLMVKPSMFSPPGKTEVMALEGYPPRLPSFTHTTEHHGARHHLFRLFRRSDAVRVLPDIVSHFNVASHTKGTPQLSASKNQHMVWSDDVSDVCVGSNHVRYALSLYVPKFAADTTTWSAAGIVNPALFAVLTLVGDSFMTYRTYVFWGRRPIILASLVLLLSGMSQPRSSLKVCSQYRVIVKPSKIRSWQPRSCRR
ncbi:hypothetical protein C8Q77DRAFT_144182 [Trametes polyzona]|nr:hypothetical protein C8Q77DRAFT_144182 [Trametes polyzona]